jgi:hypothetical protein
MADNNYPIDNSAQKAARLRQWEVAARTFVAQTREVFGEMDGHKDGSNYTGVESAYGLTTGDGTLVYAEFNSVVGNAIPSIVQLADRLG